MFPPPLLKPPYKLVFALLVCLIYKCMVAIKKSCFALLICMSIKLRFQESDYKKDSATICDKLEFFHNTV